MPLKNSPPNQPIVAPTALLVLFIAGLFAASVVTRLMEFIAHALIP
jgi:hypothetical protein